MLSNSKSKSYSGYFKIKGKLNDNSLENSNLNSIGEEKDLIDSQNSLLRLASLKKITIRSRLESNDN